VVVHPRKYPEAIIILYIIHHPVFYLKHVSETGSSLHLQVVPTEDWGLGLGLGLGPIDS
jgi:hypothetical protein